MPQHEFTFVNDDGARLYTYAARNLAPEVVHRLKELHSTLEWEDCEVCMEKPADDNEHIVFQCGHGMCMSCVRSNLEVNQDWDLEKTCPHCKSVFDPRMATTKKHFLEVHCPTPTNAAGN